MTGEGPYSLGCEVWAVGEDVFQGFDRVVAKVTLRAEGEGGDVGPEVPNAK